jgi:hypothetical protein
MNARTQRGSGILLAIIVVFVLALVVAGVLRYTSRELAGATAGRQADALVACAESGRQLLMSQFRSVGIPPTQLQALNVPLDANTGGSTSVVGGHIDTTGVQIAQVTVLPLGSFGSERRNTRDITNIAFPSLSPLGGTPYRVMVHCVDHGRQLEVEFGVRFGL